MNHVGEDVDIGFFPIHQFAVVPDLTFAEHRKLLKFYFSGVPNWMSRDLSGEDLA
jgi:hypothetical protein